MRFTSALLLLLAACDAAPAHDLVTIDTLPGGAVRVVNHGPSEWVDTNGWKLVLDHTIQPATGEPGELGRPYDFVLMRDGRVLVRDYQPASIALYERDGAFVRLIGRDGAGPGEYRSPELNAFGDTIVIRDPGLAKTIGYDTLGAVLFEFPTASGHSNGEVPVDGDRHLYILIGKRVPGTPFGSTWVRVNLRGEVVDTVGYFSIGRGPMWSYTVTDARGSGSSGIGIPFSGSFQAVVLQNATIAATTGTPPRFVIIGLAGDTLRIVERGDLTARAIDTHLRDSIFDRTIAGNEALRAVAKKSDVPMVYPAWRSLHEAGNGDLWLLSDDGAPRAQRFDVFSADGILRGSVAVPATSRFPRYSFAGERLAILDNDEEGLPRVRVYRIERP